MINDRRRMVMEGKMRQIESFKILFFYNKKQREALYQKKKETAFRIRSFSQTTIYKGGIKANFIIMFSALGLD